MTEEEIRNIIKEEVAMAIPSIKSMIIKELIESVKTRKPDIITRSP